MTEGNGKPDPSIFEEAFYKAIFVELNSEPREGIHVTHICYECLRRAYFTITRGEVTDLEGALRMWIGKKLHETPLTENGHEMDIEAFGVRGRIDEYGRFNGKWVVIDKKTCREIPSQPRPHHITQLEYYRAMLHEHGQPVDYGVILYINVDNVRVKPYVIEFTRDVEEVKREMKERRERLEKALKTGVLPPRNVSWLCRYCPWCNLCFTIELVDPLFKKKVEGDEDSG